MEIISFLWQNFATWSSATYGPSNGKLQLAAACQCSREGTSRLIHFLIRVAVVLMGGIKNISVATCLLPYVCYLLARCSIFSR